MIERAAEDFPGAIPSAEAIGRGVATGVASVRVARVSDRRIIVYLMRVPPAREGGLATIRSDPRTVSLPRTAGLAGGGEASAVA